MFVLDLKIIFDTEMDAKNFFKSIKPELTDFKKSSTKIIIKKNLMEVKINASDKSAARASLNNITKPLILFKNLNEIS